MPVTCPSPSLINPKSKLSIRRQSELLKINRSGLYYKPRVKPETRYHTEEALMRRIDYWHTTMPCCGSRKLVTLLNGEGYHVGRKLVRRLMLQMGLHVIYPNPNLSKRDFKESIFPYLLRNKEVMFPNQVWPFGNGQTNFVTHFSISSQKQGGHVSQSGMVC